FELGNACRRAGRRPGDHRRRQVGALLVSMTRPMAARSPTAAASACAIARSSVVRVADRPLLLRFLPWTGCGLAAVTAATSIWLSGGGRDGAAPGLLVGAATVGFLVGWWLARRLAQLYEEPASVATAMAAHLGRNGVVANEFSGGARSMRALLEALERASLV